ncbi:unnamed protein product [Natator depressus]
MKIKNTAKSVSPARTTVRWGHLRDVHVQSMEWQGNSNSTFHVLTTRPFSCNNIFLGAGFHLAIF